MNPDQHWEHVYKSKKPDAVSWYAPHLSTSLDLIRHVAPSRQAAIIDVGGGESTLVDDLLLADYADLTVLDIAETALEVCRERLGARAGSVHWLAGDITRIDLPIERFDVWHDRAVFHFLTEPLARAAYVAQVCKAMRPGGHVIVATFGPEGPTQCSGLDVVRYDSASLHAEFGRRFRLLESRIETHQTPFGTTQQFIYCMCRVS